MSWQRIQSFYENTECYFPVLISNSLCNISQFLKCNILSIYLFLYKVLNYTEN